MAGYRVVPASYVLLLRAPEHTEVFLLRRAGTGFMDGHWATVAGHVEPGESCLQAAARELAEEVGVRVDPSELTPLSTVHRTNGTGLDIDERVDFFFTARTWVGEPRLQEPDKADDCGWFRLDDLPQPVVPHEAVVLRALRSGQVPAVLSWGFEVP